MAKLLFSLIFSMCCAAEMVICHEDQEYPPHIYKVKGGQSQGILPEIIRNSLDDLNIKYKMVGYPWKRCIYELKKGNVHAIFAAIWSPDRDRWLKFPKTKKKLDYSRSLWKAEYPVFVRKDTKVKFENKKFSNVVNGISAPPGYIAEQKLREMQVLSKSSYLVKQALPLVLKSRIDGYVVEREIGNHYITSLNASDQLTTLKNNFIVAHWFMPVSKDYYRENTKLVEKMWNRMSQARDKKKKAMHHK
jgi:polar amino acid transport system substrate-binding protein